MIIAIHQPNYLPYLGFFDKMNQADIFVIYDDAQFNKEDFQHRNKIRIYHGWKWLTVPVEKKPLPIKEIKIKNEVMNKSIKWSDSHFRDIKDNYKDTAYYRLYKSEIETIYLKKYERLIDLNMNLINFLKSAFGIKATFIFSSELNLSSKGTQRLVDIVELLEGDTYLSGPKGNAYLDTMLFEKKHIEVKFQEFKHPVYNQYYENFIPNMSAIDALFCTGGFPFG